MTGSRIRRINGCENRPYGGKQMLTVMKFGGSSVADLEKIRNVAKRCIEKKNQGNQVVVVLSAMGKDHGRPDPDRKGDYAQSLPQGDGYAAVHRRTGFRVADDDDVLSMGVSAVSLNAWQVPMYTTSDYQNAKLKRVSTERIRKELDANKIVVVTGFQGINKYEDVTTLGRGGSDTTAVRWRRNCMRMSARSIRMWTASIPQIRGSFRMHGKWRK